MSKRPPNKTAGRDGTPAGSQVTGTRQTSRRKLLKGAAALTPAIFTLPSTASAIAFGSFAQCVRNIDDKPEYLHVEATDGWARQSVRGFFVERIGGQPGAYATYTTETGTYTTNRDVQVLVDYGSGYYVDSRYRRWYMDVDANFVDPNGNRYRPVWDYARRYTVAYVDDEGQMLGVHPTRDLYGRAVTGSCWISLLPRA